MAIVNAHGRRMSQQTAASLERAIKAGMPVPVIDSALRTRAQQRALFLDRYAPAHSGAGRFNDVRVYNGVRYVRISSAGMVAVPGTSVHETGRALDISAAHGARTWLAKHAAHYGFKQTIKSEPWHFEYQSARDAARKALIASAKKPTPKKKTTDKRQEAAVAAVKRLQRDLKALKLYADLIDGRPGEHTDAGYKALKKLAKRP